MHEILKFTLGFLGILLVGLAGVVASELFRLGDVAPPVGAVDSASRIE